MPNTILTVNMITRKALMILHQKANFIGSIDRQYDSSFAKEGAKIGDTLRIRLPNRYVIRTGVPLNTQDTVERNVSLAIANRMGVDLNFTSADLSLSLDDFSERILDPAMSVLAANLDSVTINAMILSVFNQINNMGAPMQFRHVLQGRKILGQFLCPPDNRTANLNLQDNVDMVDNLKGLFNDKTNLSKQYLEGYMGRTAGFDFLENTLWPTQARGSANAAYTVNAVPANGATTVVVTGGTGVMNPGDIFTIANVFSIHPETRVSTGILQQFVCTSVVGTPMTSVHFLPQVTSAATSNQSVNALPQSGAAIVIAGVANTNYGQSLLYHKSAFTFATADLVMPNGVDFKAREVLDGISMRIIRQYDINTDAFPCRLDVQYGYLAQRPQLAVALANN